MAKAPDTENPAITQKSMTSKHSPLRSLAVCRCEKVVTQGRALQKMATWQTQQWSPGRCTDPRQNLQ
jgi:hypothetical protein